MSQENVEIVRRGYEQMSRSGEFSWAFIDPEVEVHDPPLTPDARVYHGHDGLREAIRNIELVLEAVRFDAEELLDARIAHLWTLRDGKGVPIRVLERAEALEAAGLSESGSQT